MKQGRRWAWIVVLAACSKAPSSSRHLDLDAGAPVGVSARPRDAAIDDAAVAPLITTPPPAEQPCAPPPPALLAELERKIIAGISVRRMQTPASSAPIPVSAICEVADGWLVSAAIADGSSFRSYRGAKDTDGTVWLVPPRGTARLLEGWARGPTYDFDGNGTPEASTVFHGAEIKIWFAGRRQATYLVVVNQRGWTPTERWATWGDQIVWLERDEAGLLYAFGVRPGQPRTELPEAACALAGPAVPCARQPWRPTQLASAVSRLPRAPSGSSCAQLDDATKSRQEAAIEREVLLREDDGSVVRPLDFQWGCLSGQETPVVVGVDEGNDRTGFERWSVKAGQAVFRNRVRSGPPNEWSPSEKIEIGDHGDLDGDGFDESIVIETWSGHGSSSRFTVTLAGRDRVLPSGVLVRAPDGKRDAVVRLPLGPEPVSGGCIFDAQYATDDCALRPPAGWLPQGGETYDWERTPPAVLAWRGARFVALARAEVAAIVAATADARAKRTDR